MAQPLPHTSNTHSYYHSVSLLLACISYLFVLIPMHWSFTQNKSFPLTGHSLRTSHSNALVIHLEQFIPTHHPHTSPIYISPCIGHAQEGSLYTGLPVLASFELYYCALALALQLWWQRTSGPFPAILAASLATTPGDSGGPVD